MQTEFNLKKISNQTLENQLKIDKKSVMYFKSYEEAYRYYKDLVANSVFTDSLLVYPMEQDNINEITSSNSGQEYPRTTEISRSFMGFINNSSNSSLTNHFLIDYSVQTNVTWKSVVTSEFAPPMVTIRFSETSSSGHSLAYSGTSNMTGYNINKTDLSNQGSGKFSGTAQCYGVIAGIPNSIAISLEGGYQFSQPGSPESPSIITSTFRAKEPTIIPW